MDVLLKTVKILLTGTLLAFLFLVIQRDGRQVDFEDLAGQASGQMDMERVQQGDERLLRRLYGLNGKEFKNWVLYTARDNMEVEELLLIEGTDEKQTGLAAEAAGKRLETQKNNFDGYGARQLQLLEKGVLEERGSYLLFVVSENSEAVRAAFSDCFSCW